MCRTGPRKGIAHVTIAIPQPQSLRDGRDAWRFFGLCATSAGTTARCISFDPEDTHSRSERVAERERCRGKCKPRRPLRVRKSSHPGPGASANDVGPSARLRKHRSGLDPHPRAVYRRSRVAPRAASCSMASLGASEASCRPSMRSARECQCWSSWASDRLWVSMEWLPAS